MDINFSLGRKAAVIGSGGIKVHQEPVYISMRCLLTEPLDFFPCHDTVSVKIGFLDG